MWRRKCDFAVLLMFCACIKHLLGGDITYSDIISEAVNRLSSGNFMSAMEMLDNVDPDVLHKNVLNTDQISEIYFLKGTSYHGMKDSEKVSIYIYIYYKYVHAIHISIHKKIKNTGNEKLRKGVENQKRHARCFEEHGIALQRNE